eukprot:2543783-Pyramimonas_sp.AAC.1
MHTHACTHTAAHLRHGVLPGGNAGDAHGGGAHAVVAVPQAEHVEGARVEARHQQCEVVRL